MNLMFLDLLELTVFPQIDCSLIFSIVLCYYKEKKNATSGALICPFPLVHLTPFYPGAATIESSTDTNYCKLEKLYLQLKRKLHEKRKNTKHSKRSKSLYLTTEKCTYFIESSVGRSMVRVAHLSASE